MCIIGSSTSATVRIGVLRLLSLLALTNRHFLLSPSLSLYCGFVGTCLSFCMSSLPHYWTCASLPVPEGHISVAEGGRAGQRWTEPRQNRERLLLLLQVLLGGRERGNSTCCLGQWNSGHKLQTARYLLGTPLWVCCCCFCWGFVCLVGFIFCFVFCFLLKPELVKHLKMGFQ